MSETAQGAEIRPPLRDMPVLPIEGYMPWPFVIRLIMFASVFVVAILGSILVMMMPEKAFSIRLEILAIAFMVVILFEMILVRRMIVPLNGDYGRFIIRSDAVEFYPLSTLGMSVLTDAETVPIQDFSGVTTETLAAKGAVTRYSVTLVHAKRSRRVSVRNYLLKSEAEDYARALAQVLSLKVI